VLVATALHSGALTAEEIAQFLKARDDFRPELL